MIRVANGKQTGFIGENKIYIGRENAYYKLNASPLANPYKVGRDGDRQEVIAKYRRYLWEHIKAGTPAIKDKLERIKKVSLEGDIELVCWCSPQACHGDVIKACVEWMLTRD